MNWQRTRLGIKLFIVSIFLVMLLGPVHTIFAKELPSEKLDSNDLVYVIPIQQTIESGLQQFLQRAFDEAFESNAAHIVLNLNTFGGRVDSAVGIGEIIRSSTIPTTVFVNGKAISAGSYISLNADHIIMGEASTIGAAAVVNIGGEPIKDSKTLSFWIGHMRSAAESQGRNPDYAEAMVDDQMVVKIEEINRTVENGELLTFTADEAVKAGYAEGKASNLTEVFKLIGAENAQIIEMNASPAEAMARFLTNPIVMTVLMLIGLAGIAIELFVPGFGVPGLLGIGAFALYFFGHYIAGFAGIEHIFLFIVGVILLFVEIFVPSFGIFGIAGIISIISGVVLAAYDTEQAMLSLGIATVLAIVVVAFVAKYFSHKGIWNRFILSDQFKSESGYNSQTSKQHLLGKEGVAITTLRPAGTAVIEDERIDVVTSGEFIAVHQKIVVTKIEGTRVVVREIKQN